MTRKLTASKINSKIEELEPRIIAIAKKVSNYNPEGEWEDLYQIMLQKVLERNIVDPTFVEQTDAYILKYTEFMAKHAVKKASVYLRYVDEEGYEIDPEDSDDDSNYALDLMVEREKIQQAIPAIENEVMHLELSEKIVEGYETLSTENKKVAYMLYMGYKQTEIAESLGISKPAVSQRIKTIGNQLKGYVAGF